ncbi:rhodanese-related sulfurtransferase [Thermolongibacillus altinsuensis]|uniref:Rhodanese-related sulfurtransferase n=1 Tax=Thermolongibacillus altinsuensis TaxID=575256 RepID=A0A4R1QEU5_9BACL|nr:rhodanese-like domain-containing protein [Thermolongibacillus altinsuensis]TCL48407.1 rhodanese-related sulfurtransferase [Thermolongibacillus altinsuensis]GMB08039.1 rhodanese-like domain-containing protein [Thermolongibacillus altinsuensis]
MFENILPQEVETLRQQENVEVLDVRETHEVALGKIPNALHIPLGQLLTRLNELDRDKTYIVVCHSGGRSALACEWLSERGFQVKNMIGGMMNWEGEIE